MPLLLVLLVLYRNMVVLLCAYVQDPSTQPIYVNMTSTCTYYAEYMNSTISIYLHLTSTISMFTLTELQGVDRLILLKAVKILEAQGKAR